MLNGRTFDRISGRTGIYFFGPHARLERHRVIDRSGRARQHVHVTRRVAQGHDLIQAYDGRLTSVGVVQITTTTSAATRSGRCSGQDGRVVGAGAIMSWMVVVVVVGGGGG